MNCFRDFGGFRCKDKNNIWNLQEKKRKDAHGNRNLVYAQANYKQIIKYLAFLGYTEREILYGYDVQTQELMNKIYSL